MKTNEQDQVRKIVIPAAGWGTRFLPFTKVTPKELVPILNTPLIEHLVQEAIQANINHVIIVISPYKKKIKNYFAKDKKLESYLKSKKKGNLLKVVQKTNSPCKLSFVYQKEQLGLGHAIVSAKKLIGKEPFGVILGDDLIIGKTPPIKQLIQAYNKTKSIIFGVTQVAKQDLNKYGIVKPMCNTKNNLFQIANAIEKPSVENAPSLLAIKGRYVLNYKFLQMLCKTKQVGNEEINLLEPLPRFLRFNSAYALKISGKCYDLGSPEGFVKANVDFSLNDPEISKEIQKFIKFKKLL